MLIVALPGGIPSGNAFVSFSGYGKGPGWVIQGNQAEVRRCLPFADPYFLSMLDRLKIGAEPLVTGVSFPEESHLPLAHDLSFPTHDPGYIKKMY